MSAADSTAAERPDVPTQPAPLLHRETPERQVVLLKTILGSLAHKAASINDLLYHHASDDIDEAQAMLQIVRDLVRAMGALADFASNEHVFGGADEWLASPIYVNRLHKWDEQS